MGIFSRRQKIGPLPPKANPYPSRLRKLKKPSSLFIAASFLLLTYGVALLNPQLHHYIQPTLIEASYTINRWITHPFYLAKAFYQDSGQILEHSRLNKELLQENEELKRSLLFHSQTLIENKDLRLHARLTPQEDRDLVTVPVVATPSDGYHYSCIIAAGHTSGLHTNQPVVTAEGIVGRISHTTANAARVLLITDHQSKTPIFIQRLNLNAIAVGDGSPLPLVTYLENSSDLQNGDLVFTSGLGGIYPRGLYVGTIEKSDSGEVRLHPATTVKKTAYLYVIKNSSELTREIQTLESVQ